MADSERAPTPETWEDIERLRAINAEATDKTRRELAARKLERKRMHDKLWKRWPKGKKKCEAVLRHIAGHPAGLSEAAIRQFVWEKNGNRGKAPAYYWMTILRYPENGKLSLLEGWCERVSVKPSVWRLKPGVEIKPPFFLRDRREWVPAGEYRRKLARDPRQDGVRAHGDGDPACRDAHRPPGTAWDPGWQNTCSCPVPDGRWINKHEVPRRFHRRLFGCDHD